MSQSHSTLVAARNKPAKPYPDFPLTPHPSGVWCKKIRGKLHYFGPWDDPDGALKKYLEQKDALHAGRKPREATDGATVHELVIRFLNEKQALVDVNELSPRTWTDYKDASDQIVAGFGKTAPARRQRGCCRPLGYGLPKPLAQRPAAAPRSRRNLQEFRKTILPPAQPVV
jgi:hypothetical protein